VTIIPKSKNSDNKNMMIIGGIVAAAVVVAIIVILMSSNSSFSSGAVDYSEIPQERLADGGFVLGNPEAPITIVAFEDFLCPHCQSYKATTSQFISKYVATGMARFEYRFFPAVDPTYSALSAQFAECADILKPGSFWNAHDAMFELASASRFTNSTPRTFAERMGIPYTDLLECSSDAEQVDIDSQLGQQLGVTGTPTIMVRYGDSSPQTSPVGQAPSFEQLGIIVATGG
jgi:protein-disulfide isomerase